MVIERGNGAVVPLYRDGMEYSGGNSRRSPAVPVPGFRLATQKRWVITRIDTSSSLDKPADQDQERHRRVELAYRDERGEHVDEEEGRGTSEDGDTDELPERDGREATRV